MVVVLKEFSIIVTGNGPDERLHSRNQDEGSEHKRKAPGKNLADGRDEKIGVERSERARRREE